MLSIGHRQTHENNRDGPSLLNSINDRQLCNNVLLKYGTALETGDYASANAELINSAEFLIL